MYKKIQKVKKESHDNHISIPLKKWLNGKFYIMCILPLLKIQVNKCHPPSPPPKNAKMMVISGVVRLKVVIFFSSIFHSSDVLFLFLFLNETNVFKIII